MVLSSGYSQLSLVFLCKQQGSSFPCLDREILSVFGLAWPVWFSGLPTDGVNLM